MNHAEVAARVEEKRPLREAFVAGVVAAALEDHCRDVEVGDSSEGTGFLLDWTGLATCKVEAGVNTVPNIGDRYRVTIEEISR